MMSLTSLQEGFRELVLLEKAQQRSASLSDAQLTAMRAYHDAAVSRLTVARDIRGTAQAPVALELYREGALLYTLAYLASKEPNADVSALSPEATVRKLDETLDTDALRPPSELARVKPLLLAADPLAFDRLPSDQAEQSAQDLEIATRWLSRLFDVRSPRELKMARVLRLGVAGASALAVIVFLLVWIFSPKDLAKNRPATSNASTMWGSTIAAAVDGSTSGPYGFHSSLEDSPWLAVDLGRRYAIDRVRVVGRSDGVYDQSVPLALEVSDDGGTYKQVAERTEPFSAFDPWVVKPTGVTAQFVRVRTLRRSYLVIGELEVYGKKDK
jgi:hypothetical protein